MEHLSSHVERQQSIQWRRDKVQELSSKGNSQREIARILQVGIGTINRDLSFLRQQAKSSIKKYIDERLPEEYEKCLFGLTAILREAWNTSRTTEDAREKIQALSLAKECYSMKLDLLTNATVVDDAIRFVSSKQKEDQQLQISSSEGQEEKAKANDLVIKHEDNISNDVQGSEEENQQQRQQYVRDITTTNQTF
jgi:hypothetical protein